MRWSPALAMTAIVVLSVGAGVTTIGSVTAQEADTTIDMTQALSLTPDRPGEIGVNQSYDVPDSVTELTVQLEPDAAVVGTTGFRHESGARYAWTESTPNPSIRYRLPVNETTQATGPFAEQGNYMFVDVGEWALVTRPQTATNRRADHEMTVCRNLRAAGQGVAGDSMAFLGPHEIRRHRAAEQTFRLVIPERANLRAAPADIFSTMGHAAENLRIGDRDENVLTIAAPTDQVRWGVRGLQTGDADLWIRDNEALDQSNNVWVHEYVHTRQAFETTDATRWLTEAIATYYAALFTLERGAISFDAFQRHLEQGTEDPQADAVLARPSTWQRNAQYIKGSLVAGEVDRQLRLVTDRRRSLQGILGAMNAESDNVTANGFLRTVETAGGDTIRRLAERYTTTSAVPSVWNRSAHARAFDPDPARITYDINRDSFRVSGPYRNGSLSELTLVPGEELTFDVTIENAGGTSGLFEAELVVDGTAVASQRGSLPAGEETTITFTHQVTDVGTINITVGGASEQVAVVEPARARVVDIAANRSRLQPGDAVTVTATVLNPTDIPGEATVAFAVNGQPASTETVRLGPTSTETVTVTTTLSSAGTHRITTANGSVTIEVIESTTPTTSPSETTTAGALTTTEPDGQPLDGFGVAVALLALSTLTLFARLRAR